MNKTLMLGILLLCIAASALADGTDRLESGTRLLGRNLAPPLEIATWAGEEEVQIRVKGIALDDVAGFTFDGESITAELEAMLEAGKATLVEDGERTFLLTLQKPEGDAAFIGTFGIVRADGTSFGAAVHDGAPPQGDVASLGHEFASITVSGVVRRPNKSWYCWWCTLPAANARVTASGTITGIGKKSWTRTATTDGGGWYRLESPSMGCGRFTISAVWERRSSATVTARPWCPTTGASITVDLSIR